MSNEYENQEFRDAAQAAGVYGEAALAACGRQFHFDFETYERSAMSYQQIKEWAEDWWRDNSWKY